MYFSSTGIELESDVWLIESGTSFHITLHREWFCEYKKYNRKDVFLGDESITIIIGCGRVKLFLKDGRIKTLPCVLHILDLSRNLIFISSMSDAGVHIVFGKDGCKMVQRVMVLMRRVQCGTIYKLLGRTIIDGFNNSIVLENKNKERKVPNISRGDTMLWH